MTGAASRPKGANAVGVGVRPPRTVTVRYGDHVYRILRKPLLAALTEGEPS